MPRLPAAIRALVDRISSEPAGGPCRGRPMRGIVIAGRQDVVRGDGDDALEGVGPREPGGSPSCCRTIRAATPRRLRGATAIAQPSVTGMIRPAQIRSPPSMPGGAPGRQAGWTCGAGRMRSTAAQGDSAGSIAQRHAEKNRCRSLADDRRRRNGPRTFPAARGKPLGAKSAAGRIQGGSDGLPAGDCSAAVADHALQAADRVDREDEPALLPDRHGRHGRRVPPWAHRPAGRASEKASTGWRRRMATPVRKRAARAAAW